MVIFEVYSLETLENAGSINALWAVEPLEVVGPPQNGVVEVSGELWSVVATKVIPNPVDPYHEKSIPRMAVMVDPTTPVVERDDV